MSASVTEQRKQLDQVEALHFITNTFFELSAEKIGRIRAAFEKNEMFYEELGDLYSAINIAADPQAVAASQNKPVRAVHVAFTSNAHFYGAINANTVRFFLEETKNTQDDQMVIGDTGKTFMDAYPDRAKAITFFSFPNDEPTQEDERKFLNRVSAYDHVYIYHPTFVNVFTQKPVALDITHAPEATDAVPETKDRIDYIFEPELTKVKEFFQTRVRTLLFRRIMFEVELARTASRLMSMHDAEDRADKEHRKLLANIHRAEELAKDERLLETFAGIAKWKTTT